MRYVLIVLGFVFAVCPAAVYAADERSVEYDLALIQQGSYVAPDDPLVLMFGNVLDSLAPRCQESRTQLGGGVVSAADYLRTQGVDSETPLSLLQGLDLAVPPEADHPAKCSEYLGVLEYLIIEGN